MQFLDTQNFERGADGDRLHDHIEAGHFDRAEPAASDPVITGQRLEDRLDACAKPRRKARLFDERIHMGDRPHHGPIRRGIDRRTDGADPVALHDLTADVPARHREAFDEPADLAFIGPGVDQRAERGTAGDAGVAVEPRRAQSADLDGAFHRITHVGTGHPTIVVGDRLHHQVLATMVEVRPSSGALGSRALDCDVGLGEIIAHAENRALQGDGDPEGERVTHVQCSGVTSLSESPPPFNRPFSHLTIEIDKIDLRVTKKPIDDAAGRRPDLARQHKTKFHQCWRAHDSTVSGFERIDQGRSARLGEDHGDGSGRIDDERRHAGSPSLLYPTISSALR